MLAVVPAFSHDGMVKAIYFWEWSVTSGPHQRDSYSEPAHRLPVPKVCLQNIHHLHYRKGCIRSDTSRLPPSTELPYGLYPVASSFCLLLSSFLLLDIGDISLKLP